MSWVKFGFSLIVGGGVLSSYLDVVSKGGIGINLVSDLYVIKSLMLAIGLVIFLMGLFSEFVSTGPIMSGGSNFFNYFKDLFARKVLGTERPSRIAHVSARGVVDPAGKDGVAVELRWRTPPAAEAVEEIVITKTRAPFIIPTESIVATLRPTDPGFTSGTFKDIDVDSNIGSWMAPYKYYFRAIKGGVSSLATMATSGTPKKTGGGGGGGGGTAKYAGLPAGITPGPSAQVVCLNPSTHAPYPGPYNPGDTIEVIFVSEDTKSCDRAKFIGGLGDEIVLMDGAAVIHSERVQNASYRPTGSRDSGWLIQAITVPTTVTPGTRIIVTATVDTS